MTLTWNGTDYERNTFVGGDLLETYACGCELYESGSLKCDVHNVTHTHECRDCGASIDCRKSDAACDWEGGNAGCRECPR